MMMKNRRWGFFLLAASLFWWGGCQADPLETDRIEPMPDGGAAELSRQPRRGVRAPVEINSADREVMGSPQGTIPILVTEFPNTKDDRVRVYTPLGEIVQEPASAATQPGGSTQPAVTPYPQALRQRGSGDNTAP